MSKRNINAFTYSSDSDSEEEHSKIRSSQLKKPKKLPSFLKEPTDAEPIISQEKEEARATVAGQDDDYMNFKLEDVESSRLSERRGNNNQLKYHNMQTLSREKGLKRSLFERQSSDPHKSVGLSIMEKMGFKVGDSLGANQNNTKVDPITISFKSDKAGLGSSLHKRDKNTHMNDIDIEKYRSHISNDKDNVKLEQTIYKIRKFCFEVSGDVDKFYDDDDFKISKVNNLWRPYVIDYIKKRDLQKNKFKMIYIANEVSKETNPQDTQLSDENDGDEIFDNVEILVLLLHYLRSNFKYCWYCGCYYDTFDELEEKCPGVTEQEHA